MVTFNEVFTTNSKMDQNLISVMNRIQDVLTAVEAQQIELPEIVVVGDQSSGKSSVIESIVGHEILPRGAGLVTRRPLLLQLTHQPFNSSTDNKAKRKRKLQAKFLHSDVTFTDVNSIKEEIVRETEDSLGTNKAIGVEPIHLNLTSSDVPNLTLVDLPGLTKIAVGEQPEDIGIQIKNMIQKFIGNENAIILVIAPAPIDFATSEAMLLAKHVDPTGKRTVVVVTKLDLMDKGTTAHELLTGKIIPNKLGIVGVVNRSQSDILANKTIEESLQVERAFLTKHYSEISSEHGTPYLKKLLSNLLMGHIQECLPELKKRISMELKKARKHRSSFGHTENKAHILWATIEKFANNFKNYINGDVHNIHNKKELIGGAMILDTVQQGLRKLVDSTVDDETMTDEELHLVIQNAKGLMPQLVPNAAIHILLKSQIAVLKEPAYMCASSVHQQLKSIVQQCLLEENMNVFIRYPNLKYSVLEVTESLLQKRLGATHELIQDLINSELYFINMEHPDMPDIDCMFRSTNNDANEVIILDELKPVPAVRYHKPDESPAKTSYIGRLLATAPPTPTEPPIDLTSEFEPPPSVKPKTRDDPQLRNVKYVRLSVEEYMKIVRKNLFDSVPKAIVSKMVYYVVENLQRELMNELLVENVEELMVESSTFAADLKEAEERLKMLSTASTILSEIRKY